MKALSMALLALISLLVFSLFCTAADTESDIKEYCSKKWASDYEMQRYCIDQMHEGWRKLSGMIQRYGKDSEEYKIIGRCWSKWYPQLDMVEYCANNQIPAYNSVKAGNNAKSDSKSGDIESDTRDYCVRKWASDYEMQRYCIDQMHEAWRKLSDMIQRYGKEGEEYKIIGRCWSKWYPQLDMVEYCANNQISSYRSLKR